MPDGTKLSEFTAWCEKHITGDEKGQAQIFLDRLFQAFSTKKDLLAQLLALNQEVTTKIENAESVTAPACQKIILTRKI